MWAGHQDAEQDRILELDYQVGTKAQKERKDLLSVLGNKVEAELTARRA